MLGVQTFDALGQRWSLFLGNAAQCAVEEHYGKGFFAVVADAVPDVDPETAIAIATAMSSGAVEHLPPHVIERANAAMRRVRLSVLRDIAWHGLQRHHPEIGVEDVSDIIDDIGSSAFGDIVGAAIRAAQGKGDGGTAAPGKSATPRPSRTGRRSSTNGATQASRPRTSGAKPRRPSAPPSAVD